MAPIRCLRVDTIESPPKTLFSGGQAEQQNGGWGRAIHRACNSYFHNYSMVKRNFQADCRQRWKDHRGRSVVFQVEPVNQATASVCFA
jgi:hypothetical protein